MSTPANSINEATTGITGFSGTSFPGTPVTQYNVQVGGATTSTLSNIAPSATSGVPLISQGSSSNPTYGTAVVAGGGTGVTTMTTAYAPVCAGTTATGSLQVASTGLSTSGLPLVSNGASALPSFQALSASSINGSTSGSSPAAGVIGEQKSATGNITPLTNNTPANIANISLTAGVWDVSGMGVFYGNITGTKYILGISSTSATLPGSDGINQVTKPTSPTNNSDAGLTVCPQRVTINSTTTYYLVAQGTFTVGTLGFQGIITATRVG